MKMQVLVTGANGLIGVRLTELLADQFTITPLKSPTNERVDITDAAQVEAAFAHYPQAQAVIHLAAFTDVNAAWQQQGDKNGSAWQTNVVGTANIATACARRSWYLIHTSTAFVFSGEKAQPYTEQDPVSPIEWYGQTKAESERAVAAAGGQGVILRLDQPFTHVKSKKVDTLHRIINGLQTGNLYPQFTNHFFGPTYIDDLVKIFGTCLKKRLTGIYHASSGEQWSDYDFAQAVAEILALKTEVRSGDLQTYLQTLSRPYQKNTALNIDKLKAQLDFPLLTIRQAIAKAKDYL